MDKKTLQEFEVLLKERGKNIIKRLESIGSRAAGAEVNFNTDYPDYGDSMEDNAVEFADYTKNLSLEREMESELKDIDKALKRIENNEYGVCRHCGQKIEIERLKIRPESSSCVSCKKALKHEK